MKDSERECYFVLQYREATEMGGGGAYKENVTSEQHTHTCRKDKETDKAASTGGEDKDPERCLSIGA